MPRGGLGIGGGGIHDFTGPHQIYFWIPHLKPSRLAPLLGDFIQGRGLGAWPQKCMECPQVGRGDVFRQIASN